MEVDLLATILRHTESPLRNRYTQSLDPIAQESKCGVAGLRRRMLGSPDPTRQHQVSSLAWRLCDKHALPWTGRPAQDLLGLEMDSSVEAVVIGNIGPSQSRGRTVLAEDRV